MAVQIQATASWKVLTSDTIMISIETIVGMRVMPILRILLATEVRTVLVRVFSAGSEQHDGGEEQLSRTGGECFHA